MRELEDILADYYTGEELSDAEAFILKEWMEVEGNGRLTSMLEKMRGGTDLRRRLKREPQRGMRSIARKIEKRGMLKRLYICSAAACLVLLLGTSFFFWKNSGVESDGGKGKYAEVMTEKSFARLKLADGKVIPLHAGRNEVIAADSFFRVENTSNTLVYSTNATGERITYNTVTVPIGGEFNVMLADGTKVYLNAGSELRFPVVFSGDTREVYLEGEGYFEVAKDSAKTFKVHMADMTAVVLGTSFNVKSYANQARVATTLEEGHLKIICQQQEYDLQPGYQVRYDKQTREAELLKVNTVFYTSWKDGYYRFNEMSLEEVMEILSKWYDLDVRYLDDEVKKYEFSGRLKRYDDFTYLLDKFEETGVVEFVVDKNVVTIKKK